MIVTLPPAVLVVELSLPDRQLSPNASKGSSRLSRSLAVREYRKEAYIAFSSPFRSIAQMLRATVQATFYFKRGGRRDRDNAAAMLKPAWDGMVDAGVVADDRYVTHLPCALLVDKKRPRVEIRVYDMEIEWKENEE